MTVTVEIPDTFADVLAPAGEDVGRKLLEDRVAQAYREGRLTMYELQCILELPTRMHVDPFLLSYKIFDYTEDDLDKDMAVLERLKA